MKPKTKPPKEVEKYLRWYEGEYAEIVGLKELAEKAEKEFPSLRKPVSEFHFRYSSIWRHETLSIMKYYTPVSKTGYVCSVFKIQRKGESSVHPVPGIGFQTSYAFLYSQFLKEKKSWRHEFLSASPTFTSADGEYRSRFITLEQYLSVYDSSPFFGELEKHALEQGKRGEIRFKVEAVFPQPPPEEGEKKEFLDSLDRLRLPLKLYVSTWLVDFYRFFHEGLENHIAKGYPEAMFSSQDREFFKRFLEKATEPLILKTLVFLQRFRKEPEQKFWPLEIGQKLIPLTVQQVEELGNLRFPTWAELAVAAHVGDLVINGISPSFPLFNNWFLLRNSSPTLYDNAVMHRRMEFSDAALDIVRSLEEARKSTYILDPLEKKEIFLSFNMEGLSKAVEVPIEYAEQELILSQNTLCVLMEHVGHTMMDEPRLIATNFRGLGALDPVFTDPTWFAKYFFEFLYGALALQARLGVIHSDLHLNNITLFVKRHVVEADIPNPSTLYNLKEKLYLFPTHGKTAALIDFSRAILSLDSPVLEGVPKKELFGIMEDQRKKLLRTLERELPEFHLVHRLEIESSLLREYELMFKLFSALDAFKLSLGFSYLLKELRGGDQNPPSKILELVEKVKQISFNYLTLIPLRVWKGELKTPEEIPWPLEDIIEKCFEEYRVTSSRNLREISLVDYHCFENPLRYNTREYERFPPTIKWDYIEKHGLKVDQTGLENYHRFYKEEFWEKEKEEVEEIKEEERAERAERRGSPVLERKPTPKEVKEFKKELATTTPEFYDVT